MMKYLPILLALLLAAPAWGQAKWPASKVVYSDADTVEGERDKHSDYAYLSLPTCDANSKWTTAYVNNSSANTACDGAGAEWSLCVCNVTWQPVNSGVWFTDSAGLAAALSDKTGTGLAVFNNSPVFINPETSDQLPLDGDDSIANTQYVDMAVAASPHIATGITPGIIRETHLDDNSETPTNGDVLTYSAAGQDFDWVDVDPIYENELTNSEGLIAALSDETGTLFAVFSDAPTFTGGVTIDDGGLDIKDGIGNNAPITHSGNNFKITPDVANSFYFGRQAGGSATGVSNIVMGDRAGQNIITGNSNIFLGTSTGRGTIDGAFNVCVGLGACDSNASGSSNTLLGANTGGGASATFTETTIVGANAGAALTSGTSNLFFGNTAGSLVTSGALNILFLGGELLSTGSGNIALGRNVFSKITTTSNNVGIGYRSGRFFTGTENIALGLWALQGVNASSTGSNNIGIGTQAGFGLTTGSRNIFIGDDSAMYQTDENDMLIIDNRDRTTAAQTLSSAIIVGTMDSSAANQRLMFNADVVSSTYNAAVDAEASDTYVIALDPPLTRFTVGMTITFKANTANTGPATLNVNGLGARPLKMLHDQDPYDNYIEAGSDVIAVYDGTNFQMIQPPAAEEFSKCAYIDNPVTNAIYESVFRAPKAVTVTEIWCETDAGTVGLDLDIDDGTPLRINGTDISCPVADGFADSAFVNSAALAEDDRLDINLGTVATAVRLSVCFKFKVGT